MPDWLAFILILLAAGVLLFAAAALLTARILLRPPRMTDGKAAWLLRRLSPADLGLPFQPLDFHVRDSATGAPLRLAAWWIPHPASAGRTILLVHGYADAKVGAIAWAPVFHRLGWNTLAIDLRAHGESQGQLTTAGYHERHDLNQVIDQLRAQRPRDTRHLALFGISMGAAVAAAAAVDRDDLAAVILESPFADFRHAAMKHCDLLGLPGPLFQRAALRLAQWLAGADFAAVRPADLLARIPAPSMIILCALDPFLPPDDQALLEAAARARPSSLLTRCWRVEQTTHLMALCADPDEYARRITDFLNAAVPIESPRHEQ